MMCKKCGKEVPDQATFCPECGAPMTNQTDSSTGLQEKSQKGIYVDPKYNQLREMTEKARKNEKKWKTIGKIAAVLYGLLIVKSVLENLSSVAEGSAGMGIVVSDFAALVFFACGLVYFFTERWFPSMKARKSACAKECVALIHVNDKMQLMNALNQMNSSTVKRAYMDENGNVCVQGKRGKHTFSIQDGHLVLTSDRNKVKVTLERETIAGSLLKYLDPQAPVNAYENERSNARLGRMNMILAIVAAISGITFVLVLLNPQWQEGQQRYIQFVEKGYPESYPNVTYGEAFEAFFADGEWEYFESTENQDVVEFHGTCFYDGEEAEVAIQFLLSYDEQTFQVYALKINDEVQPEYVTAILLEKVFEDYQTE